MNRSLKLIAMVLVGMLAVTAQAAVEKNSADSKIVVEIDYGKALSPRTVEVPRVKDRTVLEILQTVARVETHPVGEHVFVTGIDGVNGKRGDMAWYYTVNGKSADCLAYSKPVDDSINYIGWEFKKDVCSEKVDNKK
ncbi:MAG: DUF4430 domain-containing protein [Candidatus Omnitrophota bacterium]